MKRGIAAAALTVLGCAGEANADEVLFSSGSLPAVEPTWAWVAGAAVMGVLLGFALGWRTLARRIRRKYGGLKIY